jgi:hypothetical protein
VECRGATAPAVYAPVRMVKLPGGHGDFCVFPSGDGFTETFTGTFRVYCE